MTQRPSQRFTEIIVGYMNRVTNPVYLGYLALETGLSLKQTQKLVDDLEEAGVVRRILSSDPGGENLVEGAVAYTVRV
jgi:hypothetical protein